ncbi:ABC transporter permease subunit [Clostridium swellfunianum]|uniref:ABC transporter permease n=1 Tax=Clostridium swellfunianum TaxID=1367462 RepID=UPI00202F103E|nr:ABC transporter permease subunit [Clostridium swellfunianum]MCM0649028.1 ABC transporter permease subunit [Clostridium swellfunianum]
MVTMQHTHKKKTTWNTIKNQKYLLLMSMPFVVWVIIFAYIPIWGWIMAFQNYKPSANSNIFQQKWVGLKHFKDMFADPQFYRALQNTLGMSILGIVFGFIITILFALFLNEVKNIFFKRVVQTFSYLPHFVSWVIAASIVIEMLSHGGIVNSLLMKWGLISAPIQFFAKPGYFWWIVTFATIWKDLGWNAIIYLSAISGIDPALYEAATVDGANRFRRIWHVTLPGIMPTVTIMLILSIGSILSVGFERQMLLGNTLLLDKADVLDWYILREGISSLRYSYGTAVGIFKSVVSIAMVLGANFISKKYTDNGVV